MVSSPRPRFFELPREEKLELPREEKLEPPREDEVVVPREPKPPPLGRKLRLGLTLRGTLLKRDPPVLGAREEELSR